MTYEKAEAMLKLDNFDTSNLLDIVKFIMDFLDKHERSLRTAELAKALYEKTDECHLLSGVDHVVINLIVVRAYMHSNYPWRARKNALNALNELGAFYLKECKDETRRSVAGFYDELASYFYLISSFREALDCYQKLEVWATDPYMIANSYYRQVIIHNLYEEDYEKLSEEEINKKYPAKAKEILRAYQFEGYIKRDPVETTAEFQKVFDEVYEKAQATVEAEGDLHIPLQRWSILTKEFAARGIKWRSPRTMNPKIIFD